MTETLVKTVEINLDNVLPMLREAVDARGDDYVYRAEHSMCAYGATDMDGVTRPLCVVGHLVHQQAGEDSLAQAIDFTGALELFGYAYSACYVPGDTTPEAFALNVNPTEATEGLPGFDVTPEAALVLQVAQGVQDHSGWPQSPSWGEAYAAAEKAHAALVAKRDAQ